MSFISLIWRAFHRAEKQNPAMNDNAYRDLGLEVGRYLVAKYSAQHGDAIGSRLAVAVSNELFDGPPGSREMESFIATNAALMATAFAALSQEPGICYVVSVIANGRMSMLVEAEMLSEATVSRAEKLEELGIFVPVEDEAVPTDADSLAARCNYYQMKIAAHSIAQGPLPLEAVR